MSPQEPPDKNGEITMSEKYLSPLFTLTLMIAITGYVFLMNCFMPACNLFVK